MLMFTLSLFVSFGYAHSNTIEVKIEQGLVIGHKKDEVTSFLNVPYATAPTGEDKFKAPLPPPTWTVLDAVNRHIICPQIHVPKVIEDCLVANIFVPDTNATNLPVMVVVHGGGYLSGSGMGESLTKLVASKKLIVVTFNYRLGVIGFLCLGTKDIPGNAGMKDQVALLRWVKRNIANFGGNPDDITICGCSAGGGSVDLLSLSPMTIGLFNKVISGSGASFGGLGAQIDPLKNAKVFARSLNFTNVDDIDALEHFFRTYQYNLLVNSYPKRYMPNQFILFTPCVEVDHGDGQEIFLPDSPSNIIKNKKYEPYPTLKGVTNQEGTTHLWHFNNANNMREQFYDYLPNDLQFETEVEKHEVAETLKKVYFGDKPKIGLQSFVNFYSDIVYNYPILKSIDERRKANNDTIYLLEYTFIRQWLSDTSKPILNGAHHCHQHAAVWDEDTKRDAPIYVTKMKKIMREIYISFVTTGKPSFSGFTKSNESWPPIAEKWSPHMALKGDMPELLDTLKIQERYQIWDDIYSKYGRQPGPPLVHT